MSVEKALKGSLRELLSNMSYDKVTVAMICTQASVSRTAFYAAYYDKQELLCQIIDDDLIEPVRQVRRLLDTRKIEKAPLMLAEQVYQNVLAQRQFYSRLNADDNKCLLLKLFTEMQGFMNARILEDFDLPDDEKNYLAYFSAAANGFLICRWIANNYDLKPARLAQFLEQWVMNAWSSHAPLKSTWV